jgi:hypothetical protein
MGFVDYLAVRWECGAESGTSAAWPAGPQIQWWAALPRLERAFLKRMSEWLPSAPCPDDEPVSLMACGRRERPAASRPESEGAPQERSVPGHYT